MGGFYNSFYGNQESDWGSGGMQVPNFFQMYRNFGGRMPNSDISDYYNEDDFRRLNKVATKDSGASQLLESYYNQMPTQEQYKPGIGRKIAGFLLGTLSGQGGNLSRNFIEAPYANAVEEWKMEAPGITQRAKNMEAAQNRAYKGTEFDIRQRIAAEKAKNADIGRGNNAALAGARGVIGDENTDAALEERKRAAKAREEDADANRQLRATLHANALAAKNSQTESDKRSAEAHKLLMEQRQFKLDEDKEEAAINKAGQYVQNLVINDYRFKGKKIFTPDGEFDPRADPKDIAMIRDQIKFYAKKILAGEKF